MIKKLLLRFIVFLQLLMAGGMVFASDLTTQTLVIGSEQDYPPFALGQTDTEADGFTVELWKEVAKEAGLSYTIRVRPFHQILQEFKEGKIDVLINLAQSDERRKFVDFSIPHVTVNGAIFVREGESGILSEADLAGKSIIVLKADLAHDYAVSRGWGKQLVLTDKAADGFKLLASGKHDAILISKLVGMQTLHELNISNIRALDAKAGFSQKFSFAVHKGDADLLAKINEALALTKPTGKFDALYEKWFGPYEEKPVTFWDVLRYLAPIALVLLGFAGYEYYKRRVEHAQLVQVLSLGEARLRAIIEALPIPVALNNQRGIIAYLNPAFVDVFGYTREDIPTLAEWWPRAYPDDAYRQRVADAWTDRLEQTKRDGKPFEPMEASIRGKDGRTHVVIATATPLYGNFEGEYMVALIDITERKNTETALQLSEERFDLAMRAANDGLWDWNMLTHEVYFSPRWKAMLGYADNELENSFVAWEQLVDDEGLAKTRAMIDDCVAGRADGFSSEFRMRHKDGHWVDILSRATIIRDHQSTPIRMVGTHVDISEQKRIQRDLIDAREDAEAAAIAKAGFLASMSHEIRTPMNGIMGLLQLALNRETDPQVRDYLEKIDHSSRSLLGILNDILDFSKLEAGKVTIEHKEMDLHELLDSLKALFQEHAQAKQLEFSISVAEDTPRALMGDSLRLQQILSNLLSNAIKFTKQGKVSLRVASKIVDDKQVSLHFAVQDTGIGISEDIQGNLFQAFTQADSSTTRQYGGTGLGLAISKQLLNLMGSDIRVDSTPGLGSTFSFDLTLGVSSRAEGDKTERPKAIRHVGALTSELRDKGRRLSGTRILVAEDNRINQQVVKEFLQLSGLQVEIANNGEEALQCLQAHDYDAVLMDLHMPVMDGVEATKRIRKDPRYHNLPIIALTAGVTQEERESSFSSGMNDFIAKPVDPEELIEVLVKWVTLDAGQSGGSPQTDDWDAVEDALPEFNIKKLKTMIGGNASLLKEILRTFLEDCRKESDEISRLLEAQRITEAERQLHKLKGAAGSLGASVLHAASEKLDAELKQGAYRTQALSDWKAAVDNTVQALSAAVASYDKKD